MPPALRSIRVLGALEAELDGLPLDLGGPKQRAVLALLLTARGDVVAVDRIIDELWRGEPPPKAMGALQAYVSKLRRVLEPARGPRAASEVLVSRPPGYAVRLDPASVDAWHFEQLVRDAERHPDAEQRVAELRAALAMWRGQALAEFTGEPWAEAEAARLEELRLHARERLIDAAIRAGAPADAAVDAKALVREAPLREEAWRLLALAQYADSRQADALATLREARSTLADELGIDPGPALRDLERDILAQQVAIPADVSRPTDDARAPTPMPGEPTADFVGREIEVEQLLAAAGRIVPGRPGIGVVSGEPGAGKSALLRRVAGALAARDWRVAVGRCPEIEGAPPAWAWAEALRSLAEDAPVGEFADLLAPLLRDDVPPPSGDADVARFRLQGATAEWLSSLHARPLVIVLDDVHRADPETRKMLVRLIQTPSRARLFFLLAHRQERTDELTEVLAAVAALDPERIQLGGLDRVAAERVIAAITGPAPSVAVVNTLLDRTEGNPFYLKESARLLASVGTDAALHTVPTGVADVLLRRLARLPTQAQALLRFAAVIGRTLDVDVLVRASTASEDAVYDALEAGEIAGLLVAADPGTVRFTHVLIRDTLYDDLPAVRRPAAHASIAKAIEEIAPSDVAALAHHLAQASDRSTAVTAARYSFAAGEQAESRLAYERAIELYRQALRCLDLAEPEPQLRLAILVRLVPALLRAGDIVSVLDVRREALRLGQQIGDEHLLAQAISCGNVPSPWINRPYGGVDRDFITLMTGTLGSSALADRDRCMVLNTYVRETSFRDDPRSAEAADQALELARRTGDPELIALSLISASEIYLADLNPRERDAVRAELREVAQQHGLASYELLANIFDAQSAATRGDVEVYRRTLDDATALSIKLGLGQAKVAIGFLDAGLICMGGEHERAEIVYREIAEAYRTAVGALADDFLAGALFTMRQTEGRLAEFVDAIRDRHENSALDWTPVLAYGLATAGDREAAQSLLETMKPLRRNWHWMSRTASAARAAVAVGDRDRAAAIYPTLLPYRDQIVSAVVGCPFGPVAHVLGELARYLAMPDQAREHLQEALDLAKRCGNPWWVAAISSDLGRL